MEFTNLGSATTMSLKPSPFVSPAEATKRPKRSEGSSPCSKKGEPNMRAPPPASMMESTSTSPFKFQGANRVKNCQLTTLVLRANERFVTHGEIRSPVAVKIRKRCYGVPKCGDGRHRGAREDKASNR